jgi:DNA-binding NtrC family response regulator
VFPIVIPPLRERQDDTQILTRYFIDRFSRDLKKRPLDVSPDALEELKKYRWPGNVRELQNAIERAVILADGDTIHARQLNLSFATPPAPDVNTDPWSRLDLSGTMSDASGRILAELERRKIRQALQQAAGNKVKAAESLQVGYKALLAKMKEHAIE